MNVSCCPLVGAGARAVFNVAYDVGLAKACICLTAQVPRLQRPCHLRLRLFMLGLLVIHVPLGLSNLVLLESSFSLGGHKFRLLLEQMNRLSLVFCTVNKDTKAFKEIYSPPRLKI